MSNLGTFERLVGATATSLAANSLLGKLSLGIAKKIQSTDKKDASLVAELMRDGLKRGDVTTDVIAPMEELSPLLKGQSNACFFDKFKRIYSSDDLKDLPGVMSHELGHASNFNSKNLFRKLTSKLYTPGKLAPVAAMFANILGHKKMTTAQQLGVSALSSLLYSPVLIEEFSASNKGSKLLRGKGKDVMDSLKSFSGVPTYIAYGLMPYLQVGSQHLWGVNKKASFYRPSPLRQFLQNNCY